MTLVQRCFDGLRPLPPTIRSRSVAVKVAKRIVKEVNLDDFYWAPEELPDRIADIADEIMRAGNPATVITRLHEKQPLPDGGIRAGHPYGWGGIDEHCRAIGDEIAAEVVREANTEYRRDYGLCEDGGSERQDRKGR
jgi:hypothetical protein